MDALSGTIIEHRFSYDSGRRVTVYLPPDPPLAVVYAADGQHVRRWAATLEKTAARPTALVGVHGSADEQARLTEYSPNFDAARFSAHETFFVTDVRQWAADRCDLPLLRERTAVFGASAGGELAIALGLRHPQTFGTILAGSPGAGYQPPDQLVGDVPRTYLVAGSREPFFLANATRWADALSAAGADVMMATRDADHGSALWQSELPLMIDWAFG